MSFFECIDYKTVMSSAALLGYILLACCLLKSDVKFTLVALYLFYIGLTIQKQKLYRMGRAKGMVISND